MTLTAALVLLATACKKGEAGTNANDAGPGPDAAAVCGNGQIEPGERCDGPELARNDCTTVGAGFTGGTLACLADCGQFDTSGCTTCGDSVVEPGEECDRTDLDGNDCTTIGGGFVGGTLACRPTCEFDATGCSDDSCGNGFTGAAETCDGPDLAGRDCTALGFDGGSLACSPDCQSFDTSACTTCGDGVADPGEACDSSDLAGHDCTTIGGGFIGGSLACGAGCIFDVTGCQGDFCGNGFAGADELCDGADLAGADCTDHGFTGGTLVCNPDCQGHDTLFCTTCGDGTAEPGETCDGSDLQGHDCVSLGEGFDRGTLGCRADCTDFDRSQCFPQCGDGVAEGTEVCDGPDLVGQTCRTLGLGYVGGRLACDPSCTALDDGQCLSMGGTIEHCPTGDCRFATDFVGADVNCDGHLDLVVSAPKTSTTVVGLEGQVHLFFGDSTGSFAATPDVTISGVDFNAEGAGNSVANLGNFTGHTGPNAGCQDIAVLSPFWDDGVALDFAGGAAIFRGRPTAQWQPAYDTGLGPNGPDAVIDMVGTNVTQFDQFGFTARNVGDFNADGVPDLAIASPFTINGGAGIGDGAVYVFFGRPIPYNAGSPTLFSAPTDMDVAVLGASDDVCDDWTHIGQFLSLAGDLDRDGFDDFLIGAPGLNLGTCGNGKVRGRAYIIFGGAGSPQTIDVNAPPAGRVTHITEDSGGTITTTDQVGLAVAGIGDINDDGELDIAVSDTTYDSTAHTNPGAVFVFLGDGTGFQSDLEVDDADLWIRSARGNSDRLGITIAHELDFGGTPVADFNGDGISDLVIGFAGFQPNPGGVAIVYGSAALVSGTGWLEITDVPDSTNFADAIVRTPYQCGQMHVVRFLGDIDGDSLLEIGIGDPIVDSQPPCSGLPFGRLNWLE